MSSDSDAKSKKEAAKKALQKRARAPSDLAPAKGGQV
jgi:hypothetical protein